MQTTSVLVSQRPTFMRKMDNFGKGDEDELQCRVVGRGKLFLTVMLQKNHSHSQSTPLRNTKPNKTRNCWRRCFFCILREFLSFYTQDGQQGEKNPSLPAVLKRRRERNIRYCAGKTKEKKKNTLWRLAVVNPPILVPSSPRCRSTQRCGRRRRRGML